MLDPFCGADAPPLGSRQNRLGRARECGQRIAVQLSGLGDAQARKRVHRIGIEAKRLRGAQPANQRAAGSGVRRDHGYVPPTRTGMWRREEDLDTRAAPARLELPRELSGQRDRM